MLPHLQRYRGVYKLFQEHISCCQKLLQQLGEAPGKSISVQPTEWPHFLFQCCAESQIGSNDKITEQVYAKSFCE